MSKTQSVIDLRSDTITLPSRGMLDVMYQARLGDDVFGEDPTVNLLQEEVARLFGKEAALFVPSGTMANQVAIKAHTRPGDEVIAHPRAHIVRAESGGAGVISGIQFRLLGDEHGAMDPEEVRANMQEGYDPHFGPTTLVSMENTHNFCGGKVIPLANIDAVGKVAREFKIPFHIDGARVLNAAIALDVQPARMVAAFDTGTLCFSKGLGAPMGSIIFGPKTFIHSCKRWRKMLGGGMRQVGMLAEAARYALKHHYPLLGKDHEKALAFAGALAQAPVELIYGLPQSNLVFFRSKHPQVSTMGLLEMLKQRGILFSSMGNHVARAVFHLNVTLEDAHHAALMVAQNLRAKTG